MYTCIHMYIYTCAIMQAAYYEVIFEFFSVRIVTYMYALAYERMCMCSEFHAICAMCA